MSFLCVFVKMFYQSGTVTSVSANQQHWPSGIEPSLQVTRPLASAAGLCDGSFCQAGSYHGTVLACSCGMCFCLLKAECEYVFCVQAISCHYLCHTMRMQHRVQALDRLASLMDIVLYVQEASGQSWMLYNRWG